MAMCGLACGAGLLPHATGAFAAPTNTDTFQGRWTSIDTDGSHQTLNVRGQGWKTLAVQYHDDRATVCGGVPARVSGSGSVDGNIMFVRGALTCQPGGKPFPGSVVLGFTYVAANDTLEDASGVVWTRQA